MTVKTVRTAARTQIHLLTYLLTISNITVGYAYFVSITLDAVTIHRQDHTFPNFPDYFQITPTFIRLVATTLSML